MPSIEFSSSENLRRKSGLVSAMMDGETVMLDVEQGEYFGIGGVGSRIWDLLEKPISEDQIVAQLVAEYEVTEAVCRQDTRSLLHTLFDFGVLERV